MVVLPMREAAICPGAKITGFKACMKASFVAKEFAARVSQLALASIICKAASCAPANESRIVWSSKMLSHSTPPKVPLLCPSKVVILGLETTVKYSFPGSPASKRSAPTQPFIIRVNCSKGDTLGPFKVIISCWKKVSQSCCLRKKLLSGRRSFTFVVTEHPYDWRSVLFVMAFFLMSRFWMVSSSSWKGGEIAVNHCSSPMRSKASWGKIMS